MYKLANNLTPGAHIITSLEWERELSSRFIQIRTILVSVDCEALLVYASREHAEPFRYLFNFVPNLGDMWAVAFGPEREKTSCFLNFHWELKEAARVSGITDWQGSMNPLPLVVDKINQQRVKRIAVLGLHRIPWQDYQAICSACPNLEWVDIQPEFDRIRRIKTPYEIRLLKEAARITDLALEEVRKIARPGLTENEISARILYTFSREGANQHFRLWSWAESMQKQP